MDTKEQLIEDLQDYKESICEGRRITPHCGRLIFSALIEILKRV